MSCKTKKGYAFNPKAIQRRIRVISRLEDQLVSKVKPVILVGKLTKVDLTKEDTDRIKKELEILKARI